MNLERYIYFTNNNHHDFEFYSEGPRGRIKKIVRFKKLDIDNVYNLAFGDENPETGDMDDSVISNNDDRDLILSTVANTINHFSEHYGKYYIFAKGSTDSRTRLYQMGISSLLEEIKEDFDLYGLKEDEWHHFEKNVNYTAFLVRKK